jgi:hypothetical protein
MSYIIFDIVKQLKIFAMDKSILIPLMEREFNPKETMQVLKFDLIKYWSWGVSKVTNYMNKGLMIKVNGNHHKGLVFITLSWMDTYTVYIMNNVGRVLNKYEEVYFDDLTEIIDNRIERIPKYVR